MKKILYFKIKSVQEYCYAFSCHLKTGFTNLNFTAPLNRVSKLQLTNWYHNLALPIVLIVFFLTGYTTVSAQNIKGVIPVSTPIGGDGIDGEARAHEPNNTNSKYVDVGDLFDFLHTTITGHGLIDITPGPTAGNVFYKPIVQPAPPALPIPQTIPVTYQIKDRFT